ncbi:MAG: hypothetical protein L7F77_05385 [Candidatus Magnetominusculus sp. LBB02]|nr:hypothetical protein [Candidatus Magnetominusculus sp. LBB02]
MITFISAAGFLFIAYRYGGDNFRWLGDEIAYAARDAKAFMYDAADKADDIGRRMHAVAGTYKKTEEAVKEIHKAVRTAEDNKTND